MKIIWQRQLGPVGVQRTSTPNSMPAGTIYQFVIKLSSRVSFHVTLIRFYKS